MSQGLGKTKDGIKTAIKPKLKFDKAGVGFDPSVEFTDSWWVKVYNDALEDASIQIKNIQQITQNEEVEKINKRKRKHKKDSCSEGDLFEACEGRTAHKGARHGLQQSGKLQRLEHQELALLPKKSNFNKTVVNESEEEVNISKKSKKKRNK